MCEHGLDGILILVDQILNDHLKRLRSLHEAALMSRLLLQLHGRKFGDSRLKSILRLLYIAAVKLTSSFCSFW